MPPFLFAKNTCTSLNLRSKETLYKEKNVICIHSLSADDALEQLRSISIDSGLVRVTIYAQEEKMFLDTEGTIEFCRLLHTDPTLASVLPFVFPVVPCDYSACTVIASLGFGFELFLTHPLFEKGITKPDVAKYIVQHVTSENNVRVLVGGIFSVGDIEVLQAWNIRGIIQYQVAEP